MTGPRLAAWLLTRRPRLAWARLAYSRRMTILHREYIPARRRRHLDIMAMRAEDISVLEDREPRTAEWMVAAELLRAAAASEYGQVLSDLYLTSDADLWDADQRQVDTWDALWTEMALTRGDRGARARILRELGDCASGAAGIGVLYEIAATEDSAARRSDTAARRMLASLPVRGN